MEFLYEGVVQGYLTRGGNRFCCPQYGIKSESGKEDWRCPDFLVLDFEAEQVILAEVSTAWNIRSMADKAVELQYQGIPKLRQQLMGKVVSTFPDLARWPIKIHLFVREDRKDELAKVLEGRMDKRDFEIIALEQTFRRWKWESEVRVADRENDVVKSLT
jgi:hypothetical protein